VTYTLTERVPTKWPTTLYGWIRKGTFPKPRRHGNRSYWIESEVDAWKRLMPVREE
jgi:predicted DNA-binding transcriptional regulator AlpA